MRCYGLILLIIQVNPHIHLIDLPLFPRLEVLNEPEGKEQQHFDYFVFDDLSGKW